jgi:signal transduction histidine kinase
MAVQKAEEMGIRNLKSSNQIGKTAIENSVRALDNKSTEAIELRTVELAQRIADFLYERDKDILLLASFPPSQSRYLDVYKACTREVITPSKKVRGDDGKEITNLLWKNPDNKESWRHRPPIKFNKVIKPLYREITFIDLHGLEKIKISNGTISTDLRDVSKKENTYCKAENYFSGLENLSKGEVYVSRVIGAYVKGWLYKTPEGIRVKPESAYAGKENINGEKFEGIIRWVTPVYDKKNKKIGYLTMALDHRHVMEFTDHVIPTGERFTEISDAGSGNYAFLWDDRDQCISHPRDFFICGYDPESGEEVPGWISQETYDDFRKSGLSLKEYVKNLPSFQDFNQNKKGSSVQMKDGCISLDCRVLDTAPQCEGWHRGTEDGGSGSFLIFWSGLWKLTTYAAVPYYSGPYGRSKRGFGYVTIGAHVSDFHKEANITKEHIEKSIAMQGEDIDSATEQTRELIKDNSNKNRNLIIVIAVIAGLLVIGASLFISLNITRPLKNLTRGAIAISRGELEQSIQVKSRDEIGQLAKSFNEMASAVSQVSKMKSEFVTTASHELRTPIHAMLLGVSGLLEGYSGDISDEAREDLGLVKEGIERLTRLVDNLLDLSRIEARKTELNINESSVTEIVEKAVDQVSDLAKSHKHSIIKNILSDITEIEVDKDKIIQVLVNLLSNSIKYSPDGGLIILKVENKGEYMIFSVADNGYGIPPWAHEKVFDKFFQADSIMSQKVGGSGLGLTITKGIIEEHGGMVRCESPIGSDKSDGLALDNERKGCIFSVYLPFKKRS